MGKPKKIETKEVVVEVTEEKTEVVEPIKEKKEIVEKVKENKPLTREQLISKLSKVENDLLVEFKNISRGKVLYVNKFGDKYLDLDSGETEVLSLSKAKEICSKSKGFFKNGSLIIVKVYDEDYSLSDILKYLKIDKIQLENYDIVEELIMNSDIDEFESILSRENKKFVKRVAGKAIYMHNSDEYDFELSLKQDSILRKLLNLEVLVY